MKLLLATVNIVVATTLLAWFPALLVLPMLFDAPGSQSNQGAQAIALTILIYPLPVVAGNKYFWQGYQRVKALKLTAYTGLSLVGPVMLLISFALAHVACHGSVACR